MKKLNASHIISNILMTAVLTASGIGCMVTAFDLTVDPAAVSFTILVWSALFCLCLTRLWSMILLVPMLLFYTNRLLEEDLILHLESFLWNLSTLYDQAYNLGARIWWTANDHLGADTTAFFQLLAVFATLITGAGLTRRRVWPGILIGVGMLAPCLVVIDTVPDTGFLFLWMLSILLLLLTAAVRQHSPEKTGRLTTRVLLPAILSLAILFAAVPQSTYEAPESNWLLKLVELLYASGEDPTMPPRPVVQPTAPVVGDITVKNVDLTTIGPKKFSVSRKFTLLTDYSGYVYLRGTEYTVYTGSLWYIQEGESSAEMSDSFLQSTQQTTQIRYDKSVIRLLPYYTPDVVFTDGSFPMEDGVWEYTEYSYPMIWNWASAWESQYGDHYTLSALSQILEPQQDLAPYTKLPALTKRGADALLAEIGCTGSDSVLTIAQKIENYVRASADYSLQTKRMPEEESDFALWFLENSDTGYCVHFATAATVLLRAAGIPARYVEGYVFDSVAGKSQSVVGGNAHAWTEYYLPGAGWVILESTPGFTLPEPPPTTLPTQPPTTIPPESTQPPTTIPPETTVPTEPTRPTEPVNPPVKPVDLRWVWTVLRHLAWGLAILAVILAQWRLRLVLLRRHLTSGTTNQQALACWRHSLWLSRLGKVPPPKDLLILANKAKFSQHTITEEELQQFLLHHQHCIANIRKKNILLQGVYRFVLALY